MKIHVSEIKEGDRFVGDQYVPGYLYWTARADAEIDGVSGEITLDVRHGDGGSGVRCWASDIEIEVQR